MKKLSFLITLFLLSTFSAFCQSTQIPLKKRPGNNHPGQKAPANYSYLPTVIYDEENSTLSFTGNADLGTIPYTIIDEEGSEVLSGYVFIQQGYATIFSIATLPAGNYTLSIEVGGVVFEGLLSI